MSYIDNFELYCSEHNRNYEVFDDILKCEDREIDIISGIPRFVDKKSYASAFGSQWNRFVKTQLDSYSGLTISEERLLRCIYPLKSEDLRGKKVLEVGCGAGRFTEILLKYGAIVYSLDLSDAVDANNKNFPVSANHCIVQSDIIEAPFRDDFFDISICLGVMQHTQNPNTTLDSLKKYTKKNGYIFFDHYRLTLSFITRMLPIYRFILKIFKSKINTLNFCTKLVQLMFPVHKIFGKNKYTYALLSRVSPIVTYFHCFNLKDELSHKEWAILDTHDSLFDHYKKLHKRKSLEKFIHDSDLSYLKISKAGIGYEVSIKI